MVQAYLYNKDTDSLQTLNLSNIDYKLSSILCEQKMNILCGYDSTTQTLKAFSKYNTIDHVNLIISSNKVKPIYEVLDYNMYTSEDDKICYFVYLYTYKEDLKTKIALSYLAFDNEYNVIKDELIDNNVEFTNSSEIEYKINFREPEVGNIIVEAYIIKNNTLYVFNAIDKTLTASLETDTDSNIYLINVKTSKTDLSGYDEVLKVNNDIIPLLIVSNTNNLPYVIFINSKGDVISKFVFSTKFDNGQIKKVLICESDTGGIAIEVYIGKYVDDEYQLGIKRIKISTSDIYESVYRTNVDFYISDTSGSGSTIAIRSKNIGFHSLYNKNLFLSKDINSSDNNYIKDKFYSDSENIIKEVSGSDVNTIKDIISNPFLKDVSGLVSNDKVDKYDGLEYNDKFITQTISRTENGTVKLNNNELSEVVSEDNEKNIPISISGINTNETNYENTNNIIISNLGDMKINEFTKIVMPFVSLAFSKFVNITLQDRELSLVFNRFSNYASIVETTRNSGVNSDFKNQRIEEIVEFLYNELTRRSPDSKVYKEQIIAYIHEYFDIDSHDIIDTSNKESNRISSVNSIDKITLIK